jgi:hydrogenase nickel incorporation protein HypA/HybF
MHELAICQSVLRQVVDIAARGNSPQVTRITLRIGPLAGIEPDLVRLAFPIVASGTVCDGAAMEIETMPVQVRCTLCGAISGARPNRLLCASCNTWRVELMTGDEMLLAYVELLDAVPARQREATDV